MFIIQSLKELKPRAASLDWNRMVDSATLKITVHKLLRNYVGLENYTSNIYLPLQLLRRVSGYYDSFYAHNDADQKKLYGLNSLIRNYYKNNNDNTKLKGNLISS